ncbi:MAG: hypothetical protein WAU84_21260 [Thermoguttaceae bacterium]
MIGKQFDGALEVDSVGPLKRADAVAVTLRKALITETGAGVCVDQPEAVLAAALRAWMVLPVENFGGDSTVRRPAF